MVVSEKMDNELEQQTNPEAMDSAKALGEQINTAAAEGDDDNLPNDQGKQKGKDLKAKSLKKKPPNQIYSPTKEEKRLVLEARHSLSIAETKKRRASVYSSESLFIPKELARKGTTLGTPLEKMAKNQECCKRMLTFPVGSGRARYVAKQMKNGSKRKQKQKADEEESKTKEDLPRNMPELDAAEGADVANGTNHLQSDDEMSILLLDMVNDLMETEQKDSKETQQNDHLSDHPQNQRTTVIKVNRQLLEKPDETEQENVLFRWHNPKYCDGKMKMRLMDRLEEMKTLPEITELQVNYSEVHNEKTPTTTETEPQMQQEEQQQGQPLMSENYNEQQESSENVTQPQEIEQLPVQIQNLQYLEQQQQAVEIVVAATPEPMRHQQHVADVGTMCSNITTSTNIPSTDALLRRQLMHHIVLDENASFQPSTNNNNNNNINNNNALNLTKQNTYASDAIVHHWAQQQQSYQPQQQAQHRQSPPPSVHQPQQHQHHSHHATLEQLQELKAMRQRLKFQEGEKLKKISKSLKKVYEERSLCERQHAEEKRQFLHKMTKSQKLEEKLQADREQWQRQHMAELSLLEQRIAERQRLLLHSDFNFQRQQAYRQQLLIDQQHFMQQQQQDQFQQQLVQHQQQQQQQHLMQSQQQLAHQHLAQQQQQQQHLAARQQQRNQQEQQHHHHHHSPSFYTPPHAYEGYRPAPPPAYKPQLQGHPEPPTTAPQPPPPPATLPPYAVPPAHPVVHHPSPPCTYQQRMQLFRESQIQIQPQLMEDQSARLLPPPSIYIQPATTAVPPPPPPNPVPPPPRRSPEIQATCQPTIRTMRRRHTITHGHIIDHRTLPYVLSVPAAASAAASAASAAAASAAAAAPPSSLLLFQHNPQLIPIAIQVKLPPQVFNCKSKTSIGQQLLRLYKIMFHPSLTIT
ncbi:alpha-protein kinase 1 [Drosophila tropicalis]|uniref:alpha-protein kinase 1 n=1 Tax=Drosophila tropicalis TaxID=46794 RepID=UPI0035ABC25A